MANPSNFQVTPCGAPTEGTELNFSGLYLYHTYTGPNPTQRTVIQHDDGIGGVIVNNWIVREGLGSDAKVVARAQGVLIHAENWHNSFSLVFEEERFKGSTLQVMGIVVESGEWAIVGGTGQFAMASGIIHKKFHKSVPGEGGIIELTIRGFCPLLNGSRVQILPAKLGPWGGNGGTPRDITEPPKRLESITIRSGAVIDAIAFSYVDQRGQKHTTGQWGGPGGSFTTMIELASFEYVKEVSGTVGVHNGVTIVTSLRLVTNDKTYGTFGKENGTPFKVPVQERGAICGFFARSGQYIDAIGVYVLAL